MWLYKPIENKQITTHKGAHTSVYAHTLQPFLHFIQVFHGLIVCFHVLDTSNKSHALKQVQRKLFLVSEDTLLIHPASADSYGRPTLTHIEPTEECCQLFKEPAMHFPEPHRGFGENKAQRKQMLWFHIKLMVMLLPYSAAITGPTACINVDKKKYMFVCVTSVGFLCLISLLWL